MAGRRGAGERGFTMAEAMMAVVLIAILAAMASPSFIHTMRDRRVASSAQEVAELYRLARMRSLGRGSAVLVRWTASGGKQGSGLYEVREAVTAGTRLPSSSCVSTSWANGATTSVAVTSLDTGGVHGLGKHVLKVGADAQPTYEVCYTPRGRTFARASSAATFQPMTGSTSPGIDVTNEKTSFLRQVVVPPNGVARLIL